MSAHREDEETVERVALALLRDDQANGHADECCSLSSYKSAARAAIAAMPDPWRTIDSAPKDGTWIMVGAVNLYPCDAYWHEDELGDGWHDNAGFFAAQPTHWRPLPSPPVPS